ncbi:methyl-accepting chemotaxis protein [Oceanidesulfovibrio indonesiensis]|uniref:Methyl-accepting chemotaxis protein n=1 Tax=Oceanidesulfovibrio indonesiensis TaxID=54767 RepID=A0A7M3MGH9_9BACT|nr:methyl-accepting chemotaxis protein [Oceanidesulfovibrio indonesiensis]TVM18422.1 methyl-accepting chemotaxis protein [Oceanidesulfovibrio indonesiensis]
MSESDTFTIDIERALKFEERCERELPQLDARLARTIQEREPEFLELGNSLQEYSMQASHLAEETESLAGLTSAEAMESFRTELHQELDKMTELWSKAASDQNVQELTTIHNTVETLTKTIDEYRRVVRALSMLGISTRIESARLGAEGRGFTTLADDVEKLAKRIVEYSGQIMEKVDDLSSMVTTALEQTGEMRARQAASSRTIENNIRTNLDALVKMADKSGEVSRNLEPLSRQIASSIGEAVASVQFHDITRQQVEHVEESLQEIRDLLHENEHGRRDDPDALRDLVGFIGDVCGLQHSQLVNASDSFYKAVESLKSHLGSIAGNVFQLESNASGITASETGGTTLDAIEAGLGDVMDAMKEFADQGEAIGAIMVQVADTVTEMTHFLEDIEEVGSEIELISLNASVKAAHTGDKGKALGVLASSIQQLSQEAGSLTESVTDILGRIGEASTNLKSNAEAFMDTSQVSEMITRIEQILAGLRRIDEEVDSLFETIRRQGADLGASIESLNNSMTFHEDVCAELSKGADVLAELRDEATTIVPHDEDESRPERLDKMLARYTMEAERLIHQQALKKESCGPEGGGESECSEDVDDWGDVELF